MRMRMAVTASALAVAATFGAAGAAFADSGAVGAAVGSPGVLSGNTVQIPIHVPINLCGNSIDIIALLNPTFGNTCVNGNDEG
ncbi:chaplin [Streptomyces sp. NPDC021224]|uniref:chaplin n=1 Tax=unclassified Streptomyces TaxID=2593676 RepID=UPI0037BACC58